MKGILVCSDEDITRLATLAYEIWHEYWPDLIGSEQTCYMVKQFQSEQVLAQAIKEDGYRYYFLVVDERVVGYTGAQIQEGGRLFLSKLYLVAAERGKGFAREVMNFYEALCKAEDLHVIFLTVNKHNDLAIGAYRGMGFTIVDSVINDIGGGFVMDDYIMEKRIAGA